MIDYPRPATPLRSGRGSEPQQVPAEQQSGDASDYLRVAETWVGAHPAAALGVALVVGAGVGWLLKRR